MARFKLTSEKGLLLCRVQIWGKGEPLLLKLAIDTGATRTIIPPEAALSIGINPARSKKTTEITTGSGTVICPVVIISKFSCFGVTLKKLSVVCHNLPPESPVEGLLGLDFLRAAKIILNFAQEVIEIGKSSRYFRNSFTGR